MLSLGFLLHSFSFPKNIVSITSKNYVLPAILYPKPMIVQMFAVVNYAKPFELFIARKHAKIYVDLSSIKARELRPGNILL